MNLSIEETELLDRYQAGKLTPAEAGQLDLRLSTDASFRQLAEQHFRVIHEMKRHNEREYVRGLLNKAHDELPQDVALPKDSIRSRPKGLEAAGYWKLSGIAASVALVSIVATFLITQSLKNEQTANYKELRRNVEQIKKSQKIMMDDIAEQKTVPPPASYAGTSFLISTNGYLTTSYHVVKEADSIYVENETFGNLKAIVVYQDQKNDIALLKIPDFGTRKTTLPYAVSKKETSLAEEVFTLGYPREEVVFGSGSISAMSGYNGNPIAYQISVPVNPGNSGGPLFNSRGDLVGIISGQQTQTSGAAFAIKSTILLGSIDQAPDSVKEWIPLTRSSSLWTSSRVDQVNEWRKYVFMVRVYKD